MFKKQYTWDQESMDILTTLLTTTNERVDYLSTRVAELREKLDRLEKEPKVINNYYTQSPPTYPVGPYPNYPWNPTWTSDETTGKKPMGVFNGT